MSNLVSSIVTVLSAIIGLAVVAVLVSNRASTTSVISAAGKAFSGSISAATNPFSGGSAYGASFTGGGVSDINFQ